MSPIRKCLICNRILKPKDQQGNPKISFFSPPPTPHQFEAWRSMIPEEKGTLRKDSIICEQHFAPNDLQKYFVTNPDGSMREKQKVKIGAVPHIPTAPENLPIVNPKRKSSDELENVNIKRLNSENAVPGNSSCDLKNFDDSIIIESSVQSEPKVFDFKSLSENLDLVKKPDLWWRVTSTEKYLVWGKWNIEGVLERHLIVEQDLTAKIFLKNMQLHVPSDKKLNSANDVSALVEKVNNLKLCKRPIRTLNRKCLLYLSEQITNDGKKGFCDACKTVEARLRKANKRKKSKKSKQAPKCKKIHKFTVYQKKKNLHFKKYANKKK